MKIIDFSEKGKILVSGPDTFSFLQNLTTNDLNKIKDVLPTAFVDRFGKIIALADLYKFGEDYILVTDSGCLKILFEHLKKNSELGGCQVENVTYKYGFLHVFSEKSVNLKIDVYNIPNNVFVSNGLDLIIPSKDVKSVFEKLKENGGQLLEREIQEALRIEKGIPEYGKDYDGTYTIMEVVSSAGLFDQSTRKEVPSRISYEKGCFLGQETLARMKTYKGEAPKKVVKLEAEFKIDKLEECIGKITSFCSKSGKFTYLASLKKPFYSEKEIETKEGVLNVSSI